MLIWADRLLEVQPFLESVRNVSKEIYWKFHLVALSRIYRSIADHHVTLDQGEDLDLLTNMTVGQSEDMIDYMDLLANMTKWTIYCCKNGKILI